MRGIPKRGIFDLIRHVSNVNYSVTIWDLRKNSSFFPQKIMYFKKNRIQKNIFQYCMINEPVIIFSAVTIYGFHCFFENLNVLKKIKGEKLHYIFYFRNLSEIEKKIQISKKKKRYIYNKKNQFITIVMKCKFKEKNLWKINPSNTIGLRILGNKFLKKSKMWITTSVNITGNPHKNNIEEISNAFPKIPLFEGKIRGFPSKIIEYGSEKIIRK